MITENFNIVVENRLRKTKDTLIAKADEYARGDRLSNFKQIAHLSGCTQEKALSGLVAKHIVAMYDFINDLDKGVEQPYCRWDEKIGDIITYMCLLDAMRLETYPDGKTTV
jgi:hypothetical protein